MGKITSREKPFHATIKVTYGTQLGAKETQQKAYKSNRKKIYKEEDITQSTSSNTFFSSAHEHSPKWPICCDIKQVSNLRIKIILSKLFGHNSIKSETKRQKEIWKIPKYLKKKF